MHDFVSVDDRKLYDLRYFHIDEMGNGNGNYTCGIAFETMTIFTANSRQRTVPG